MIVSPELFFTYTLRSQSWGIRAARVLAGSLAAVDPGKAVADHLTLSGGQLRIGGELLDREQIQRVYLLAIGKAALPMAFRAGEILGSTLEKAFVLTKAQQNKRSRDLPHNYHLYFGGHPIPTPESLNATQAIIKDLSSLSAQDLVIAWRICSRPIRSCLTAELPSRK
jgi:glycerate-2-kinase